MALSPTGLSVGALNRIWNAWYEIESAAGQRALVLTLEGMWYAHIKLLTPAMACAWSIRPIGYYLVWPRITSSRKPSWASNSPFSRLLGHPPSGVLGQGEASVEVKYEVILRILRWLVEEQPKDAVDSRLAHESWLSFQEAEFPIFYNLSTIGITRD